MRRPRTCRIAAALLAALATTPSLIQPALSAGDIQSRIDGSRTAAAGLKARIAAQDAAIAATSGDLRSARARLAAVQARLALREAELRRVQGRLLDARTRLLELENRLGLASRVLAANLLTRYEGSRPDVVTAVIEARGFRDLLERVSFLSRIGRQDATVLRDTRAARSAVQAQATSLAALEERNRRLTSEVLIERRGATALEGALLAREISQIHARNGTAASLAAVSARLRALETRRAAQARAAAAAARAATAGGPAASSAGRPADGIRLFSGGMVQAPPGAPAAVGQVIAAGNAIAGLPYVWGGGHGSFQANGYDCSGSVSYALAAAGLLSSPLDSTGFESWGQSGPGRWITVYANAGHAFMVVAGWRFDTVALSSGGTRWSQSMTDTSAYVARHPAGL